MFRLPNGTIVSGEGYTEINGIQYPLLRMTPADRAAIGVEDYTPPAQPDVDHRFYFVSQDGEPVARPIEDVRRWMKKQVREQAREISCQFYRNSGHDVAYVLDKLADVIIDGATLTQNQKDKVREAITRLRRMNRLDNDRKQKEAAIDAVDNVVVAQAVSLDISEPSDVVDTDLGVTP